MMNDQPQGTKDTATDDGVTTSSQTKSIKYWTRDERPREKMMLKGAAALSDAELLGILIHNGTREKTAIDLARDMLAQAGNDLNRLARYSLKEFQKTKGIGLAKAVALAAALELGRRRQLAEGMEKKSIKSSVDAAAILFPLLQDKSHEVFCVLYLNHAKKLIHYELVSMGGVSSTVVDIKIILKNALQLLASVILVAHNHPSGNVKPSNQDRSLTGKLKDAASMVDISLCDHIIIAENKYFSFLDEGLL